jgi:hypothetical protein
MSAGVGCVGAVGYRSMGLLGGIAGAGIGAVLGWILWKTLCGILDRMPDRRPTEELHSIIRAGHWQVAAGVLRELSKRGEDVTQGLPLVRDMLLSDNAYVRGVAYAVLTELFPAEASAIGDYDPRSPSREVRERLRLRSQSDSAVAG